MCIFTISWSYALKSSSVLCDIVKRRCLEFKYDRQFENEYSRTPKTVTIQENIEKVLNL